MRQAVALRLLAVSAGFGLCLLSGAQASLALDCYEFTQVAEQGFVGERCVQGQYKYPEVLVERGAWSDLNGDERFIGEVRSQRLGSRVELRKEGRLEAEGFSGEVHATTRNDNGVVVLDEIREGSEDLGDGNIFRGRIHINEHHDASGYRLRDVRKDGELQGSFAGTLASDSRDDNGVVVLDEIREGSEDLGDGNIFRGRIHINEHHDASGYRLRDVRKDGDLQGSFAGTLASDSRDDNGVVVLDEIREGSEDLGDGDIFRGRIHINEHHDASGYRLRDVRKDGTMAGPVFVGDVNHQERADNGQTWSETQYHGKWPIAQGVEAVGSLSVSNYNGQPNIVDDRRLRMLDVDEINVGKLTASDIKAKYADVYELTAKVARIDELITPKPPTPDTTAPTLSITAPSPAAGEDIPRVKVPFTFQGIAGDESGVAQVLVSVYNKRKGAFTVKDASASLSGSQWSFVVERADVSLKRPAILHVKAKDNAGNWSLEKTLEVRVTGQL